MWKSDKFYFSAQKIKKLNKIGKKNTIIELQLYSVP